ncbi:MAG: tRNA (adenine-N1)-methyltransferase [Anaerolineales bacterium]|jgi:tRNA (adenine57-N1/adenine58-N1)-methyltransferase
MKENPSYLFSDQSHTKYGDLVQLVTGRDNSFLIRLEEGKVFQSHHGLIPHEDLNNILWGSRIQSHLGKTFIILQPALDDLIRALPRKTQILYPKDIGYILVTMGIGPGIKIIEAGTGSGGLTTALAFAVGREGKVISYDIEEKNTNRARDNLKLFGLEHRVTFKTRDIQKGFDENNYQAVFLDLANPETYIGIVRNSLIPGGYFGCILPTTNQVSNLITALKKENFSFIEVSEILHRYYKTSATRFRPVDKMVGHTGYLIFARKAAAIGESVK